MSTPGSPANGSGESGSGTGRFARWWSGWRVAIRIARRDARRYKWRSTLIVVMVGLPVLLLSAGITWLATAEVNLAESVPRVMGSAQARLNGWEPFGLTQTPDAQSINNLSRTASPAVPGFARNSAWTINKVQKVTGGRVIQMFNAEVRIAVGDRRPSMPVLGIDARDPMAAGMTDLVSGRWASTRSEVVVTKLGMAKGLPDKGKLVTADPSGQRVELTVVGVAVAQADGDQSQVPFLVALPEMVTSILGPNQYPSGFLLERDTEVTWSEVRRMNDYGMLVKSRHVFLSPPSDAEMGPVVTRMVVPIRNQLDLVLLLAAVGLFIETTLLAGPAFAVSAARQRRSLALAATNGAEARQLRRYVLGQAVVLGVLSATIAVVAGVLLALAGLTWWTAGHADFSPGPFEVSWPRVIGVLVCAIVASLVAALLPAKGIGRLDIVSVLAGRDGDHTVRRGLPAAGAVVMAVSGGAVIWGAASGKGGLGLSELVMAGGAVGLVLGCLMVIPALLGFIGRFGARLMLPLRLATRDTGRTRGRSTPAVAAIMAAVAALTAVSIGAASNTQKQENRYKPSLRMGTGTVMIHDDDADGRSARAVIERFAPQLLVVELGLVGEVPGPASNTSTFMTRVPRKCTDVQILHTYTAPDAASCTDLGQLTIYVGSLASLPESLSLSSSQRAVLETGGILVTDPKTVEHGTVTYVSGTVTHEDFVVDASGLTPAPKVTAAAITHRAELPAMVVDTGTWAKANNGATSAAWILPQTAKEHRWPVRLESLQVSSPTGTISTQEQSAVADRLGDGYTFEVECGYQNTSRSLLLILFSVVGLLVLIASLISTALSLAEGQNDMATLAAVGATRHTRRGLAGSQAVVVAACGCALGLFVGLVPGIAITWPLTTLSYDPLTQQPVTHSPTIVIPWLPLVTVCVAVPLLAGALAWLAVRRHPQMTRRLG